jgi:predicted ATPase
MPTTPDVTPPDYSTSIGQVRLLIPDTEQLGDTPAYLFSDPQIQAFLSLYGNNVKRAAAQAKLVLATSEALINKVIKTYDFQTDGAKLGAELRAQAAELRAEAERDELDEASNTFLVANQTVKWDNSWL